MEKTTRKRRIIALAVCIIICTAFSIVWFCMRTQPHVDEIWSYMLANKYDSPFLYTAFAGVGDEYDNPDHFILQESEGYKAYFDHWHDGEYYKEALTVQPGERFAYDKVYIYEVHDTHPPLYYALVHTICSLFANKFSWWFAFSINIAFYIGTLILMFALAKKFGMNDTAAILVVLFWGLSGSGVNDVCYLRMYMMLTFFMVAITYVHLLLDKHFCAKYLVLLIVLDVLGFLTQHYAYIYVFFLTLIHVLYLFLKRRFKHGFLLGFSALGSVGLGVAIFPAVIHHIFSGMYTNATFGEHKSYFNAVINTVGLILNSYTGWPRYFNRMDRQLPHMFVHIVKYAIIIGIPLHLIWMLVKAIRSDDKGSDSKVKSICGGFFKNEISLIKRLIHKMGNAGSWIVLFASLLSALLITHISPTNMGVFTVRYLFLVMPLFSLFAVMYLEKLFSFFFYKIRGKKAHKHGRILMCSLYPIFLICIIGSHVLSFPSYFLLNDRPDDFQQCFEDSRVVFVDESHHSQAFTAYLMNTVETYPTARLDDTVADILEQYKDQETPLYLVVRNVFPREDVENFLEDEVDCNYDYIGEYMCSSDDPYAHYYYRIT